MLHLLVSTWSTLPMTSHFFLLFLSGLTLSSALGLDDVFFSPRDQTAHEGETVFFPCVSGESSPPASISWLKDGKPVTRGRQIQGEYGGGNQRKTSGTLHLYNITLEDDGLYICISFNSLLNTSKRSKPAKLTVQGECVPRRLHIVRGPDNLTVATGKEVSMHCAVGGFPVPMVRWFKDDCLLTNCSASFSLQNNGQLLTFRNVTKKDEGYYHCEAYNQIERIRSQSGFLLSADMDWNFVQQPSNITVKKGDNVTMTCRPPDSTPPARVSWFKNNQLLPPAAHVSVLPSGDLFIHRVQERDSGSYFCRASNTHIQRFLTSGRAVVTVLASPSVTLWPKTLTVPPGARVVLQCHVSGHPLPSISWLKSGHSKQTGGKTVLELTNASLYIQSARSYDEGVYVCHASNSLGHSQQSAVLKVAVSPMIVNFAGQVSCRVGASAVLPCRAVGVVPITYTWTKKRGDQHITIDPNEEMYIDGEGALHISSVHWSDEGEYHCTAKNRAGQHQRRTFLTVRVKENPADRVVLSANTSTSHNMAVRRDSFRVTTNLQQQHLQTTPRQHVQARQTEAPCVSSHCGGLTEFLNGRETTPASFHLLHLDVSPSQYFVTQMPPPIFPPPPHPNFKSSSLQSQLPISSHPTYTKYLPFLSHPKSTTPEHTDGPTQTERELYKSYSELLASTSESLFVTQASLVTLSPALRTDSHQEEKTSNETTSKQIPETRLEPPGEVTHLQPPSTEISHQTYSFTQGQDDAYLSSTQSAFKNVHIYGEPLPTTPTSPPLFPTQQPSHSGSSTLNKMASHSLYIQPTVSNTPPVNQTYNVSTLDTQRETTFHVKNSSEEERPMVSTLFFNATEKNTSQSPRVTQKAPSWLPMLEKHDIPIVVGVGVSLAFIFISVTFYSMVQTNEPAPTSRAAQRNLGVPSRHADRRAAGRTYENRAFEDDDCVAVIEQSPNTSDTRARPPGPSLVTVQLEPTSKDQQEDSQFCLDLQSVTVETYPEPILDTKMDHCLEEENGLSLSQPSIQLQCAEDWLSVGDDNHGSCQDTLPPPSPLPSPSTSPSPPSKRDQGLRSSLTLQSAELSATPIHHSLSISHGHPPLLLSHHVSLGPTNVAVDVHFHPASSPSIAVQSSTHINAGSSPMFSAPLANPQEGAHK